MSQYHTDSLTTELSKNNLAQFDFLFAKAKILQPSLTCYGLVG